MAHALLENRNKLLVDFQVTTATGTAERESAARLVDDCIAQLRRGHVTPHVSQNATDRSSAIDCRTTRPLGYALSQRVRKPAARLSAAASAEPLVQSQTAPAHPAFAARLPPAFRPMS